MIITPPPPPPPPHTQMMLHYNISDYGDVQEFVALLAVRLGRVKKGGVPDVNKAAKTVLQDWNRLPPRTTVRVISIGK